MPESLNSQLSRDVAAWRRMVAPVAHLCGLARTQAKLAQQLHTKQLATIERATAARAAYDSCKALLAATVVDADLRLGNWPQTADKLGEISHRDEPNADIVGGPPDG